MEQLFELEIEKDIEDIEETENIEDVDFNNEDNSAIEKEVENDDVEYTEDIIHQYFGILAKYSVLTKEEEIELCKRMEGGDKDAKNLLVLHNLKLVVYVAKKYAPITKSFSLEDLISEGNIGLLRAIETFDYKKGYKFSTYATWWIRQSITRAISDKDASIRIPVHLLDKINTMKKVVVKYKKEENRNPTDEELIKECEITEATLENIKNVFYQQNALSLDDYISNESEGETESTILDFMISDSNTEEEAMNSIRRKQLEEELSIILTERENDIIRKRFGFDNDRIYTLEEIGLQYGITRERIRQIEGKALRKLKNPRRIRVFKEWR